MTRKPVVLVLASTYPRWDGDHEPGFVHELCRRLVPSFDVVVVTSHAWGALGHEMMDGVDVIRYRYAPRRMETLVYGGGIATHLRRSPWKLVLVPWFIIGQYLAARRVIRHRRVDAIHAHWLIPQGLIARRLKRRASIPYLVTSHGGDLFGLRGRYLETLKRRVAADACGMTVVSQAMREEAARIRLQPPELEVLPMGVDLQQRFVPDPDAKREAAQLLFVGRLVPKKGLPHLLDAMPIVLAQRPDATLTIAGFGPEEAALKVRVRRLGLTEHVRFLGAMPQNELSALYRRASVFVAPFVKDRSGNQEGLPVVLMEAIGCGCPVIVGDVAGVRDLLGDAAADVCVDPKDSAALAAAILATLHDPQRARARAGIIREAAQRRVDWNVIADGYARALQTCLGQHAKEEPRKRVR